MLTLQHCVFSLSAGTRWHTDGSITFKSLCSLICGKRFRKIKGEIVSYKQFLSTVTWGLQSSRLHIKSSYDTRLWDKRSLLLDDQQAWQQALLSGGVLRTPPSVSTRGSEGKNTHSGFHASTWNHGDSHETVHVPRLSSSLLDCVDGHKHPVSRRCFLCCIALHFFFCCNWPNVPAAVRCCREIGLYCFLLRDKSVSCSSLKPL